MTLYAGCSVIEMENVAQRQNQAEKLHHHERDKVVLPGVTGLLLPENQLNNTLKENGKHRERYDKSNLIRRKAKRSGCYTNRGEIKSVEK